MANPLRCRFRALRLPERHQEGFVLPLVVAVGLLITIGSMALVLRGSGALIGSARQQRSREALAIAEAGLESTLAALNTTHPYLLTNNHNPAAGSCWDAADGCPTSTARFPKSICRNMTEDSQRAIPLSGSISNASGVIGDWRIVSYTFRGNDYFGGSGSLRIEGSRRISPDGPLLARAQVEQEVAIRPKDCTPTGLNTIALLAIEAPMNVNQTKVYALTAEQVAAMANDANNDGVPDVLPLPEIFPTNPAAVHCINCSSLADLNISGSAVGLWGYGPKAYPPLPGIPDMLVPWTIQLKPNQNQWDRQIWARVDRPAATDALGNALNYYCKVLDEKQGDQDAKVTHCYIDKISISGSAGRVLKIVYPSKDLDRQVRIHVKGDIKLSGQSRICQALYSGTPVLVRVPLVNDDASELDEKFRLSVTVSGQQARVGTATISETEGLFFPNSSDQYSPVNNPDPTGALPGHAQDDLITVSNPTVNEDSPYVVFVVTNVSASSLSVQGLSLSNVTTSSADYDASNLSISTNGGETWLSWPLQSGALSLGPYQYPPSDLNVDPPCLDNPGSTGINSLAVGLKSRDLLIFGNPNCTSSQDITLNGGPQTLHLFVYAPCSDVTINGGSSTPDIFGSVWSKTYTPSGSGNVDIWVPPDLNSDLETIYGGTFSITARRPVALGSNRWSSFETLP